MINRKSQWQKGTPPPAWEACHTKSILFMKEKAWQNINPSSKKVLSSSPMKWSADVVCPKSRFVLTVNSQWPTCHVKTKRGGTSHPVSQHCFLFLLFFGGESFANFCCLWSPQTHEYTPWVSSLLLRQPCSEMSLLRRQQNLLCCILPNSNCKLSPQEAPKKMRTPLTFTKLWVSQCVDKTSLFGKSPKTLHYRSHTFLFFGPILLDFPNEKYSCDLKGRPICDVWRKKCFGSKSLEIWWHLANMYQQAGTICYKALISLKRTSVLLFHLLLFFLLRAKNLDLFSFRCPEA